jgi:metal-responsive CopG/Arc/MetJ family transcriptional regulator
MVRTQIQIPADQHQRLKDLAHQRGISLSELIRRILAEKLEDDALALDAPARLQAVLAVCGPHRDPAGITDVGHQHDTHLSDAFA